MLNLQHNLIYCKKDIMSDSQKNTVDDGVVDLSSTQSTVAITNDQASNGTQQHSMIEQLGSFVPILLIFGVFYFLVLRPQEKKKKEHESFVLSAKKGEHVVTTSGIYGNVAKVNDSDNTVDLEIAEKVIVKIMKSSILDIVSRKKS